MVHEHSISESRLANARRLFCIKASIQRTNAKTSTNKNKAKGKQTKQKVRAIKSKVKGLGQAFFPKGLRVSRGQSPWSSSAEDEIRLQAVNAIKAKADIL